MYCCNLLSHSLKQYVIYRHESDTASQNEINQRWVDGDLLADSAVVPSQNNRL